MYQLLLIIFVAIFVQNGSSFPRSFGKCPNIDPFPDLNMNKMLGHWYAIQDTSTASSCVTYTFETIQNKPGHYKFTQTKPSSALLTPLLYHDVHVRGYLSTPDSSIPARMDLELPFPHVLKSKLTIFMTDYNNYAAIFTCKKHLLTHKWTANILSRTPTLDMQFVDQVRTRLSSYNINPFLLSIIKQTNCAEHGEKGIILRTVANAIHTVDNKINDLIRKAKEPKMVHNVADNIHKTIDGITTTVTKNKNTDEDIIISIQNAYGNSVDTVQNTINELSTSLSSSQGSDTYLLPTTTDNTMDTAQPASFGIVSTVTSNKATETGVVKNKIDDLSTTLTNNQDDNTNLLTTTTKPYQRTIDSTQKPTDKITSIISGNDGTQSTDILSNTIETSQTRFYKFSRSSSEINYSDTSVYDQTTNNQQETIEEVPSTINSIEVTELTDIYDNTVQTIQNKIGESSTLGNNSPNLDQITDNIQKSTDGIKSTVSSSPNTKQEKDEQKTNNGITIEQNKTDEFPSTFGINQNNTLPDKEANNEQEIVDQIASTEVIVQRVNTNTLPNTENPCKNNVEFYPIDIRSKSDKPKIAADADANAFTPTPLQ